MSQKSLHPVLQAVLEFGPLLMFLVAYFVYRNETFLVGGTEYSGFVTVTALFLPVLLLSTGILWVLTGRLTRIQLVMSGMLVIFGGLSVALNDPRLFKMKPTAIYLMLAAILGVGLLRRKYWLKLIVEEMFYLKKRGWQVLTQRVIAFCLFAAVANEGIWRTQSEAVWVVFESLVMPGIVLVFLLAQIPLFVTYAGGPPKERKKNRARSKA
jgi:intracellular septation protein